MIDHLYIDNYRCFTNFEWKPGVLTLLLGDNGSGKSSLFDVIKTLQAFLTEPMKTETAFPSNTRTATGNRTEQTFELGILGNEGRYTYGLIIEHHEDNRRNRIKQEQLKYNDVLLYQFDGSEAHLFRDDGSAGSYFPIDWSKSLIESIPERKDNTRLTWFRKRLRHVHLFSPIPQDMRGISESEKAEPDCRLAHYVSWLRYLFNTPEYAVRLKELLQPVLDGFEGMRLKDIGGSTKELVFTFDFGENGSKRPFDVPFNGLSDGQRCLTVLYTSLVLAENEECSLLWDEPDNYVSLREIQPWLTAVRDLVEEQGRQCILISHHPELINTLAAENGMRMYRGENGHARIKPFQWEADGISPAEIVARGWED